jgi:hypothetical protein
MPEREWYIVARNKYDRRDRILGGPFALPQATVMLQVALLRPAPEWATATSSEEILLLPESGLSNAARLASHEMITMNGETVPVEELRKRIADYQEAHGGRRPTMSELVHFLASQRMKETVKE